MFKLIFQNYISRLFHNLLVSNYPNKSTAPNESTTWGKVKSLIRRLLPITLLRAWPGKTERLTVTNIHWQKDKNNVTIERKIPLGRPPMQELYNNGAVHLHMVFGLRGGEQKNRGK